MLFLSQSAMGGRGEEEKPGIWAKRGRKKVRKVFFGLAFLHVPLLAHSLEKFLAPASGLMNTASKLPEKNRINYCYKFDPFSKKWCMPNPKGIHVHWPFWPNNSLNPSLKMGGRNRASFLPFLPSSSPPFSPLMLINIVVAAWSPRGRSLKGFALSSSTLLSNQFKYLPLKVFFWHTYNNSCFFTFDGPPSEKGGEI